MKLLCNNCGKEFPAVQKKKYLDGGIQRNFYECKHCGATATIFYSDKELRKLIAKQQKEKNFAKRQEREQIIKDRMAELRLKHEEVTI